MANLVCTLKMPWKRNDLISFLQGLADTKYQYCAWVDDKRPTGGHDEFDYTVHFFFDDTDLAYDADSWIGIILKNQAEADAVKDITKKIDFILNKYGTNLSDKEYIETEEWKFIVEAAKDALKKFNVNPILKAEKLLAGRHNPD